MKNWLNSIVRFGCGGMKRLHTVHWKNGWQITADPRSPFPSEDVGAARERLSEARRILREQGEALHGAQSV